MSLRCPYCGNGIEKRPEFADMSFKRRAILGFVIRGGAKGVKVDEIRSKFFFNGRSDTTIRTTIHGINQAIKPNHILTKGGVVKLVRD
jgi:hypothetical protein